MRLLVSLVALLLAAACGARTGLVDGDAGGSAGDGGRARDDAGPVRDAGRDAGRADAAMRPDAAALACRGRDDVGRVSGSVPGATIRYPFVVAGVESPGSHSCPRLFIRAGADAAFGGDRLEIEVDYVDGDTLPLRTFGRMVVFAGADLWEEMVQLEVTRADGLFDRSRPMEDWRASFTISHHDATTDLEGFGEDVPYCDDFAICI